LCAFGFVYTAAALWRTRGKPAEWTPNFWENLLFTWYAPVARDRFRFKAILGIIAMVICFLASLVELP
jgi:hypothetical protein